ncbi:MAG: TetR family transcriptional regulator [Citromicrobium sp.]|nr:TetR family transcriptional regulator [Citromicrobium sp.]
MATRKRLSPEESRAGALEAARDLLIEAGPQAVTLKAVGARVGRTHANLLHHFGSAAGLQQALGAYLAQSMCDRIKQSIRASRSGAVSPRVIVDQAFDAFDGEGGGALVSWLLATGQEDALEPFARAIHQMIEDVHREEEGADHPADREALESTLMVVLIALGQSLLGAPLCSALNLPQPTAREIAERMLVESLDRVGRASV